MKADRAVQLAFVGSDLSADIILGGCGASPPHPHLPANHTAANGCWLD